MMMRNKENARDHIAIGSKRALIDNTQKIEQFNAEKQRNILKCRFLKLNCN